MQHIFISIPSIEIPFSRAEIWAACIKPPFDLLACVVGPSRACKAYILGDPWARLVACDSSYSFWMGTAC
jgi:hypothetical protein